MLQYFEYVDKLVDTNNPDECPWNEYAKGCCVEMSDSTKLSTLFPDGINFTDKTKDLFEYMLSDEFEDRLCDILLPDQVPLLIEAIKTEYQNRYPEG